MEDKIDAYVLWRITKTLVLFLLVSCLMALVIKVAYTEISGINFSPQTGVECMKDHYMAYCFHAFPGDEKLMCEALKYRTLSEMPAICLSYYPPIK